MDSSELKLTGLVNYAIRYLECGYTSNDERLAALRHLQRGLHGVGGDGASSQSGTTTSHQSNASASRIGGEQSATYEYTSYELSMPRGEQEIEVGKMAKRGWRLVAVAGYVFWFERRVSREPGYPGSAGRL